MSRSSKFVGWLPRASRRRSASFAGTSSVERTAERKLALGPASFVAELQNLLTGLPGRSWSGLPVRPVSACSFLAATPWQASFVAELQTKPGGGGGSRNQTRFGRGIRSSCAALPYPVASDIVVPTRLILHPEEVMQETAGNDVLGVPYCPVSRVEGDESLPGTQRIPSIQPSISAVARSSYPRPGARNACNSPAISVS